MMTDALAQWFGREYEAGRQPWIQCESLVASPENRAHFIACIEGLRDSKGCATPKAAQ